MHARLEHELVLTLKELIKCLVIQDVVAGGSSSIGLFIKRRKMIRQTVKIV